MKEPTDDSLDNAVSDYFEQTPVDPRAMSRMEANVLSRLHQDSGPAVSPFSWLTGSWWRPVVAGALPLVFGFVVGLNITIVEDYPADIAGMVYLDTLDEIDTVVATDDF